MSELAPQNPESPKEPVTIGMTAEQADAVRAEKTVSVREKQRELLQEARKAAAAMFRKTSEPVETAKAPESPKAPISPAPDAAALAAHLEKTALDRAAKAEAQSQQLQAQVAAERTALAKAQAEVQAKALLAQKNPYEFLKAAGLNPDKFQAQLLNGGQPTEMQQLEASVSERIAQIEQQNAALRAQLEAEKTQANRRIVLSQLEPLAQREFPLVAAQVGTEAALDKMIEVSRQTGQQVNPQEYLAALEAQLVERQKAYLNNPAVAAKLGLSVKTPKEDAAAGPRTLTNKVTSSTGTKPSTKTTWQELQAAGRAKIQELKAAGRL